MDDVAGDLGLDVSTVQQQLFPLFKMGMVARTESLPYRYEATELGLSALAKGPGRIASAVALVATIGACALLSGKLEYNFYSDFHHTPVCSTYDGKFPSDIFHDRSAREPSPPSLTRNGAPPRARRTAGAHRRRSETGGLESPGQTAGARQRRKSGAQLSITTMTEQQPPLFSIVGAGDGWKAFLLAGSSDMTLRSFADQQIARMKREGKTCRKLAGEYERHLLKAFGDRKLSELEVAWFVAWAKYLVAPPPHGRGLERSTTIKMLAHVKTLLEEAVTSKLVAYNPARIPRGSLPRPRAHDELEHARAIFSVGEMRRIMFDRRCDFGDRLFRGLLLLSGMRFGEGAAFRWNDVRPTPMVGELDMLVVWRALDPEKHTAKETKAGAYLYVPVHPRLAELLADARAWWRETFRRDPKPEDLIAPYANRRGHPRARVEVLELRHFKRDLARLNIRPRKIHFTRHTFISQLAAVADVRITRRFTHVTRKRDGDEAGAFGTYVARDWDQRCRELLKLQIEPPLSQLDLFT